MLTMVFVVALVDLVIATGVLVKTHDLRGKLTELEGRLAELKHRVDNPAARFDALFHSEAPPCA